MVGRRGLRAFERRTVVIHTRAGTSLRGVLVGDHKDCLVLDHARHLDVDEHGRQIVAALPGAIVLRENVDFIQPVPATDETTP